ncbi:hypothetical protein H206_05495 [Candidatus Electrothrix aarhusensis]|uniref:Uncharacterized protein n=1 Tax=Candidatus Electrothrix aarhusensis TaxID=1859131 RepID=A0A3S3QLM8_9BACT|nr:hypothetical protein H206_05495 [Candidatus Electrothrix aarhusensis]
MVFLLCTDGDPNEIRVAVGLHGANNYPLIEHGIVEGRGIALHINEKEIGTGGIGHTAQFANLGRKPFSACCGSVDGLFVMLNIG